MALLKITADVDKNDPEYLGNLIDTKKRMITEAAIHVGKALQEKPDIFEIESGRIHEALDDNKEYIDLKLYIFTEQELIDHTANEVNKILKEYSEKDG